MLPRRSWKRTLWASPVSCNCFDSRTSIAVGWLRFEAQLVLAYRVPAPDNTLGIEQYFVLWIKPAGGQLSPFLVYCLDLPSGFPSVSDRYSGASTTELNEPIVVTGLFFSNGRRIVRATASTRLRCCWPSSQVGDLRRHAPQRPRRARCGRSRVCCCWRQRWPLCWREMVLRTTSFTAARPPVAELDVMRMAEFDRTNEGTLPEQRS